MELYKSNKELIGLVFQICMWILGIIISYIIGKNSKYKEENIKKKSTLYAIRQELINNLAIIDGNINYCELNNIDQIDSTQVNTKLKSDIWNNCITSISYVNNEVLLNKLSMYYRHISMTQSKDKMYVPKSFSEDMKTKGEEIIELIDKEL